LTGFDNAAFIVCEQMVISPSSDVTIAPVSIAHGNLSISIETQFSVSQPNALAKGGQTVVVPEQKVTVTRPVTPATGNGA